MSVSRNQTKQAAASAAPGMGMARALYCLVGLGLLVLGGRLVALQHVDHASFRTAQEKMLASRLLFKPSRGALVDCQRRPLAVSVPVRSCALDPQQMEEEGQTADTVLSRLASILELSPRELEVAHQQASRPGRRFVWVRRHLSQAQTDAVRQARLPGVLLPREYERTYPQGRVGAHLLGFTDVDGNGLEGMEKFCDPILLGLSQSRPARRDARNRRLVTDIRTRDAMADGLDVELSLDASIQAIVEEEMDALVKKFSPSSAMAVVMDPFTGDILAMVNRPTFDPNDARQTPADQRLNRSIASVYEPGSIFKPLVFCMAMETGKIKLKDRVFCENGAWRMACGRVLHDTHGYGWLSAEDVVVKSSNIGIAKVAAKMGMDGLYRAIRAFGFGEESGIHLEGELPGLVRERQVWNAYSMGSVPMGQEIAVTPLQMVAAYGAIANGGYLLRPRVVRAVYARDGRTVQRFPVVTRRRVLSDATAAHMRKTLRAVVTRGTGRQAKMDTYALGGKTGTANLPMNAAERRAAGRGGYSDSRYASSFIALAPYDVPRLVVLVSAFEPKGAYYGGTVAAPAVREISRRSLQYLHVPPMNQGGPVARR